MSKMDKLWILRNKKKKKKKWKQKLIGINKCKNVKDYQYEMLKLINSNPYCIL